MTTSLISHLAFIDHLFLFAEAFIDHIEAIQLTLKLFCESYKAKVSTGKTHIYFSNDLNQKIKLDLSSRSDLQCIDDLGKYLGVPILHKKVTNKTLDFLLDKVNKHLSCQKSRMLTLAKLVIQALSTYVMQSAFIPKAMCDSIDRKCHSFVQG